VETAAATVLGRVAVMELAAATVTAMDMVTAITIITITTFRGGR
jgi:hypothetical protein